MKRLLSLEDLDDLIALVEEKASDPKYEKLLNFLQTARHNKYGDGSLYAVNWAGAICLQCHKSEF